MNAGVPPPQFLRIITCIKKNDYYTIKIMEQLHVHIITTKMHYILTLLPNMKTYGYKKKAVEVTG
jgi:hypothetical protein